MFTSPRLHIHANVSLASLSLCLFFTASHVNSQGSFYVTFYVAVAGMLIAMAAVVPDWPYLNRHPIAFAFDSPEDKED